MAGLVLLASLVPTVASAAGPAPEGAVLEKADRFVREQKERAGVPGVAYSVVRGDELIHSGTYGEDGRGDPVTTRTPFLVGSLAKPVTALAVMRQVEAGKVELNAPVRRYLPWFHPKSEGQKPVTVRQLLNQSSGLSERDGITRADRFDNEPGGVQRVARDLADVSLSAAPGERHEYSNANYMLLGALLEEVTGKPFDQQLRENVLKPLGMDGALTNSEEAERAALAPGHRFFFGQPKKFDFGYDTSGVPYGYFGANLKDLSAFASAQLTGSGLGVLSRDGFRQMHQGTVSVHDRHRYGFGWRDDEMDGLDERMVWHSGATPGYHGIVVLLPEHDLAVVVQYNAAGLAKENLLNNTAFGVARILLGAEPLSADEDSWLTWILVVLGTVAAVLAAAVGWSAFRVIHPRRGLRRGALRIMIGGVAAMALCLLTAAAACIILPQQMGGNSKVALLFVPDAGWLLVVVTALALVLAPLRMGMTIRALTSLRRQGRVERAERDAAEVSSVNPVATR
ncbi:serine hydrolase [Streptomyces sp. NBC_01408]|uniref:serine hydrolase domain-containing protein n=1 Tax=Streptomyces sp. NBC_01408 TaxID=2903855 RepID=UPI002253E09A|nr:serine hydrolase domain-containing protein [Streptomyces sp. NBC_01408]MCX4696489.1 beta-lactamase family protein [Streptomyces sp. NBC_01408]